MLPRKVNKRQIGVHIDMTPMVDVMMLLVIFFMMTTAFVTVYPGFTINLPQAAAKSQETQHITVLIAQDGRIAVDGRPVAKGELTALLTGAKNAAVSIQADKEVSHGQVVEVMDEIQRAGVAKIAIAVREKGR
ncbi:ExbD/TolR family protein [Sporomusa sphaeroides]|uniref:Biopolymer transport protein ExbD/TolR n=1 Tax=uncultured Sporomusa sp. TaxID=307249 RepID=A0A212LUI0_9FIRM|nr:biopolymer transporter ExbD [Sporomusa sphaeroides]SCM81178.1 conserved hypothetical protein [uncultured Sporomusa sp.]